MKQWYLSLNFKTGKPTTIIIVIILINVQVHALSEKKQEISRTRQEN